VVVLNEHSGFGSSNAAPTAVGLIKKYMELKAQDEAEHAGAPAETGPAAAPTRPAPAGGAGGA